MGVKRLGREAEHSNTSLGEFTNVWSWTSSLLSLHRIQNVVETISTLPGKLHEDMPVVALEPGGAITPMVGSHLPIAAALLWSGFSVEQSNIGVGFPRQFSFTHTSPTIIQGWCNWLTSGRRSKWASDFQPVCRGTLVWREGYAGVLRESGRKFEYKRQNKMRNKNHSGKS
jgi:hypothetical protein